MALRDTDGKGCLQSNGGNKLLEKAATSDCARFRFEGTLLRSVDVPGQCLDYFRGKGFGLWSCHGKDNQQFRRQGLTWCVDSKCVEASEAAATYKTTTTTSFFLV